MTRNLLVRRLLVVLIALVVARFVSRLGGDATEPTPRPDPPPAREAALAVTGLSAGTPSDETATDRAGAERIRRAFEAHESDVVVEGAGVVERLLPDDLEGSRHQRFILRLPGGGTILVSHNIDLASRLEPLAEGDRVRFRGEYEWNERGGVVHWTHHDPAGRRDGGWLERNGQRVQ